MTGSVTSKSTVSLTCALAEETVRLRRRRTGVPSWSVSTWAAAARAREKTPARRMMNLSEAGRARRVPKHDPEHISVHQGPHPTAHGDGRQGGALVFVPVGYRSARLKARTPPTIGLKPWTGAGLPSDYGSEPDISAIPGPWPEMGVPQSRR